MRLAAPTLRQTRPLGAYSASGFLKVAWRGAVVPGCASLTPRPQRPQTPDNGKAFAPIPPRPQHSRRRELSL